MPTESHALTAGPVRLPSLASLLPGGLVADAPSQTHYREQRENLKEGWRPAQWTATQRLWLQWMGAGRGRERSRASQALHHCQWQVVAAVGMRQRKAPNHSQHLACLRKTLTCIGCNLTTSAHINCEDSGFKLAFFIFDWYYAVWVWACRPKWRGETCVTVQLRRLFSYMVLLLMHRRMPSRQKQAAGAEQQQAEVAETRPEASTVLPLTATKAAVDRGVQPGGGSAADRHGGSRDLLWRGRGKRLTICNRPLAWV